MTLKKYLSNILDCQPEIWKCMVVIYLLCGIVASFVEVFGHISTLLF